MPEPILPITWEDKVNSAELLAYLQQFGPEVYLSAEEINQLRDAINQLFSLPPGTTDVKFTSKNLSYSGGSPTNAVLAGLVNALPAFTVFPGQLPLFVTSDLVTVYNYVYKFVMVGVGEGTYGVGGTALSSANIQIIYKSFSTVEEIETNPENLIVNFGEIGAVAIETHLNLQSPPIALVTTGSIIIKTLVSGLVTDYLFIGTQGTYGVGALTAVTADFEAFALPDGSIFVSDVIGLTDLINGIDSRLDGHDDDIIAINAELATKLNADDYNDRFKGKYLTEAALIAAHPTASVGDYAQVNETGSNTVTNYNWDDEENGWIVGGGSVGPANTDELPEGSTNLYHTTARVLATLLTGISFVTGGAIVSTDSVLVAFGKIQKQITDGFTTANIKSLLGITTLSGSNTGDQDLSGLQPKGVQVTNATTTGSYAVDWNAADVWQLTLTGATTITDTNLPTGTATKVIELMVKGAFSITLPAYWEATPSSGAYTGAKWNHFVISCIVGTTSSEKVIYSNEVLAT